MAYFTVISLKVLILLLATTKDSEAEFQLGNGIVAKVIQKLFNTYSASLVEPRSYPEDDKTKTQYKEAIDKIIQLKVDELKPYLEDNSTILEQLNLEDNNSNDNDINNNVTLEGDEDTTIIEFVPQADYSKGPLRIRGQLPVFEDNVKKYKKMRDLIETALIEESVSNKSQKLILNTLDSMLAHMVRSQCPSKTESNAIYRESIRASDQQSQNYDLTRNWTKKWNEIREKYNNIWKEHFPQQNNPARKLFMFFEQIQDFMTSIMNDSIYITNNYKVECKLVKADENEVINFNDYNLLHFKTDKRKLSQKCPSFRVCSGELKKFMSHLYKALNRTVAHTFNNYAAMYSSDINSDGSGEKEIVVAAIIKLGIKANHIAKKVFKFETSEFDLDHDKNADNNIKLLKTYVHDVIEKSLTSINNFLHDTKLDVELKEKLILSLKQDLQSSVDVDLGNLRMEMKNDICRDFSACNGMLLRREVVDGQFRTRRHLGAIDKNKVYVKLQLSLDKHLKDKIVKGDIQLDNLWKNNVKPSAVTVTRTTLKHVMRSHATRTTQTKTTKQTNKKHKDDQTQVKPFTRLFNEDDDMSEMSTEM